MIERSAHSVDEHVRFAESLARIAGAGGGAKALAAHLSAALDAAVLVEDGEWRHVTLVGSGARPIPPSMRELLRTAQRGFGETVALAVPGGGPPLLATPLRAGDESSGWLGVFPVRPLATDASALIRLTAAAIAVEIGRDGGGGRSRRKSFWERLIATAYDDPIEAKDDAASCGITLAPAYVAVAVEAEGLEEASATAKHADLRRICSETLRAPNGETVAIERGGALIFLCPALLEVDAANARTAATLIPRAAAKAHFDAKIVGGVGRSAEAIHAARSVDDAREAMFIARRMFGGSRVMPYEDLGIYPLLLHEGAPRDDLRGLAKRVLGPLRAYDEKHQTELLRTLSLYFAVGQNVKVAAAELGVHRHTIVYRLRQVAEIGGYSLDSPHDQLTLRTAMAIDALISDES